MILPNYYLLMSSSLFSVPMLYGIYKKKYLLSTITGCAMFCSIIYWISPVEGVTQNLDLMMSKLSGITYFLYGVYKINSHFSKLIGCTNLSLMMTCYNSSCSLYNEQDDKWIYYHIGFHLFTVIGKMFVLEFS